MVEIRCKSCGGLNQYASLTDEMECAYCGVMLELDADRGRFVNLYRKADDAWDRKDFDEALRLYEQIVDEDASQSEAHWGAAMCRYGVAYVVDPLREVKMPTCNRVNRTSILEDKNYLAAIRHAGPNARAQYENRAQEIDRISRQFLKIVEKEKPYDVFISYKKTGADGRNTIDSQYGRKLYHYLTEKGFTVFFAEETLASVAGSMYEPFIFAALTSAKVMVLLGSCREHFDAVWVKNEWHRFLALQEQDPSKALIPVYIRCKPEDELPLGLNLVQAMDADHMTFLEDVAQIVQKKKGAAPQAAKAGKLNLLSEKYATKANVDRVVNTLDCEPDLAAEVLIIHQGKVDEAIRYISSSADYQKKMWVCAECNAQNTHDVCHNAKCGISKADSIAIRKKRDEVQRETEERRRKEEEQRKREYARSKEAKRMRAAKRSAKVKKVLKVLLIIAVIAAALGGIFFLMQKAAMMTDDEAAAVVTIGGLILAIIALVIRRIVSSEGGILFLILMSVAFMLLLFLIILGARSLFVQEVDDLYTPEIVKTYTDDDNSVLIIHECTQDGIVRATRIEVSQDSYLKVSLVGEITSKKNNGDTTITWSEQNVEVSENATWTQEQTVKFKDRYKKASTDSDVLYRCDKLYTPEIIQTYSSDSDVLTFYECSADGRVTGQWESWGTDYSGSYYIKLNLDGQIVAKNDGDLTIHWIDQEQVMASNISWKDETFAYISDHYGTLSTDKKTMESGMSSDRSITSVEDLNKLSGGTGVYFLTSDIDLAGVDWTPIEDFNGTLFGNGHAIRNMTIDTTNGNAGFFGTLGGSVSNLVFENASVTVNGRVENVGILCGTLTGVASNISVSGIVSTDKATNVGGVIGQVFTDAANYMLLDISSSAMVSGAENVGGIVGYFTNDKDYSTTENTISNCKNSGAVTGSGSCVGGIIGKFDTSDEYSHIVNTENTGDVTGKTYVGGIAGYMLGRWDYNNETADQDSSIQNSSCAANITGESYIGCIAGYAYGITIDGCSNTDSTLSATGYVLEDGSKNAYVGGFAGYGSFAINCVNQVVIDYTAGGQYVGGIFGYANAYRKDTNIMDLENAAPVSGADYVGGIFGYYTNPGNYDITRNQLSNLKNSASVTGTGDYVGGMIGMCNTADEYIYISDCANTGSVTGKLYVGGIVGFASCRNNYTSEDTDGYIRDSSCAADITGKAYVGCIAGYSKYLTIYDCSNVGSTLTATGYALEDGDKNAYVGGFVGYGSAIYSCTNEVHIAYTAGGRYVGGIMGYSSENRKSTAISQLVNNADVSGGTYVGGLFGYYQNPGNYESTTNQFDECINHAAVSGSGNYVGGLFGMADLKDEFLYITSCENHGKISGKGYVGGIGGSLRGKSGSYVSECITDGTVSSNGQKGKTAGELVNVTVN